MTNMNTNYTACFSVVLGIVSLNHLREECRIMVFDVTGIDTHHDSTLLTQMVEGHSTKND